MDGFCEPISFNKIYTFFLPVLKPWHNIALLYSEEPLVSLPAELHRIEPHSYKSLGAPYGNKASPWMLRREVIRRLLIAQKNLQRSNRQYFLAIFDAWRPIRVQKFMYEYAIKQECLSRGILNDCQDSNLSEMSDVIKSVSKFWALPTYDKSTPPPHSTGGAVDLTITTINGDLIDMGGEIDSMEEISQPNYYYEVSKIDSKSQEYLWHTRRMLLANAMKLAGFAQHPNEWWHFSYGDQLWAWSTNSSQGYYGSVDELDSNSVI